MTLFLRQGHLTAPYCARESCFDKVDDPAYLPTHRYLSLVSPGKRNPVDYHVIDTGGGRWSMIMMSVLPFFASMSSQASVYLGKGMAAQTGLLRSPIFKRI